MTDRNQLKQFITHARRGRSLSLKEDFFIGFRVRDDLRKWSSPNFWPVEISVATFVVYSWLMQVMNLRRNHSNESWDTAEKVVCFLRPVPLVIYRSQAHFHLWSIRVDRARY